MPEPWASAVPADTAARVRAAKRAGRPVVAVGTTVVRTLETWGLRDEVPLAGETALLIQPGYAFRVVDQLHPATLAATAGVDLGLDDAAPPHHLRRPLHLVEVSAIIPLGTGMP